MAFRRFEDIEAWQDARVLTKDIYLATQDWKDYGLRDQIRRSAVSIMANIAEGFGRASDPDFARFLGIAQASALETASHLYVAKDLGYMDDERFGPMLERVTTINRRIGALARHLKQTVRSKTSN